MAIKLKCPSCRERLFADESDRGGTIRCPGCETRVPVPAADGDSGPPPAKAKTAPVIPVLRPMPARGEPVDAEIVDAAPAKPRVATAIPTLAPVAKPEPRSARPSRDDEDEDDRPTRRRATSDEDEDDDEGERRSRFRRRAASGDDEDEDGREEAKGGNGLLFVILGVGVLLLAGIGVGVYFLTQDDDTPPVAVAPGDLNPKVNPNPVGPKINPNPNLPIGPNPFPNPNPPFNPLPLPERPAGWEFVNQDGFSCQLPPKPEKSDLAVRKMLGKQWESADGGVTCTFAYLDRQPDTPIDPVALAREAFQLPADGRKQLAAAQVNGREFTEVRFADGPATVWVHVTEDRVFLAKFVGPEAEAGKRNFFRDGIIVSFPLGDATPRQPFEPVATAPDDGFTVEMPGGAKVKGARHVYGVERVYHVGGKMFESKDGEYTFRVYYHDLANAADYDDVKFLAPVVQFPWKAEDGGEAATVGGKPGRAWTIKHHTFQNTTPAATVRVGFRVFTLYVIKDGLPKGEGADPVAAVRGKKFIDSLKITFDPAKAPTQASDPAWQPMARTIGFAATGPRGTTDEDYTAGFFPDLPKGKHFWSEDDTVKCHVYIVQMTPKHDPAKTVNDMVVGVHNTDKVIDGPNKITHDGAAGEEMLVEAFPFKNKVRVRTFVYGSVAVALKVEGKRDQPEREVELKARAFFAGFRYGAGAGPGGGNPVNPGGGTVTVGNGEFASAGKLTPFWSAVVLPGRKEIITIGARSPAELNPGGVLRRYSYPEFKLKATYHLPNPANRVAADEKSGKLICASVTKYTPTLDQREQQIWNADVQLFDLNKITGGTLAEAEELKPLKTISPGGAISGLDADGSGFAYVAAVVSIPPKPPQPARGTGKLLKIDLTKMEVAGTPIAHPEPLDGLRMNAAGGLLVTSETVFAGPPLAGKQYHLLTVDPITWKKSKLIPIPAPAKDLTFTGDGVVAIVALDGKTKAFGYTDGSPDASDITPKDFPFEGFGYLRVTANGKKAVASGGAKQTGVLLANVTGAGEKAKFAKVTSGAAVAGTVAGGHFFLTPDGKYAVFNCGAVIDLEKTTAPKEKE